MSIMLCRQLFRARGKGAERVAARAPHAIARLRRHGGARSRRRGSGRRPMAVNSRALLSAQQSCLLTLWFVPKVRKVDQKKVRHKKSPELSIRPSVYRILFSHFSAAQCTYSTVVRSAQSRFASLLHPEHSLLPNELPLLLLVWRLHAGCLAAYSYKRGQKTKNDGQSSYMYMVQCQPRFSTDRRWSRAISQVSVRGSQ